jgi:hypothetical protein
MENKGNTRIQDWTLRKDYKDDEGQWCWVWYLIIDGITIERGSEYDDVESAIEDFEEMAMFRGYEVIEKEEIR